MLLYCCVPFVLLALQQELSQFVCCGFVVGLNLCCAVRGQYALEALLLKWNSNNKMSTDSQQHRELEQWGFRLACWTIISRT